MKKNNSNKEPIPGLGNFVRPSLSVNKEIVSATTAKNLGKLFDTSFNARIGVLAKSEIEIDRLTGIAERLLQIIPKDKLNYLNFIIVDNNMDLRNEVFAPVQQIRHTLTDQQLETLKKESIQFLSQVIQKSCTIFAKIKDANWNKDELRNELEKMKEYVFRTVIEKAETKNKKPGKPLLFSKKKDLNSLMGTTENIVKLMPLDEQDKTERSKLMFTSTRAREDSLPSDLVKTVREDGGRTYSFLDMLAADGFETNDLENFEEQVILKLDKLKEHILHQFNPVFNELNAVRKRLRHLAEQSGKKKIDRKSIMKERKSSMS